MTGCESCGRIIDKLTKDGHEKDCPEVQREKELHARIKEKFLGFDDESLKKGMANARLRGGTLYDEAQKLFSWALDAELELDRRAIAKWGK